MRILNLYACLGGNRFKWGDEHEITAVELDPELARLYQERFPQDRVIVADAHQYLLDHFKEYDLIWSSPLCPTHSRIRISQKNRSGFKPVFPDMKLYEEIIFLQNYFEGQFIVENVLPYYEPLVPAQKRGRHLYWANFSLPVNLGERKIFGNMIERGVISELSEFHQYDFTKYKGKQRIDKIARNLVDFEVGKTILDAAMGVVKEESTQQVSLF